MWKISATNNCSPNADSEKLISFFRDRNAENIYISRSEDDGLTWSDCERTILPNNNAGIFALALKSGRIAMLFNPTTKNRNVLAIAMSDDGGVTWPHSRSLEDEDTGEFSYPTMRQDDDGVIHISYTYLRQTIKYVQLTEDWIRNKFPEQKKM